MKNKIYPCLWFDGNAPEAAKFYTEAFGDAGITQETPMVVLWDMDGQVFMGLNGGPQFRPNPAVSFMILIDAEKDTEDLFQKLSEGGKVLMELGSYPWSEKYAWVEDRFGISWQLYTDKKRQGAQKYVPTLMFTGDNDGKCGEAIHFYTSVFKNSGIDGILKYEEGSGDTPGHVQHAQFKILDYTLMAMDSGHDHGFLFTEGTSLVVVCDGQEEIDGYWEQLTSNGGHERRCGWLKDRYGFSWQIIPKQLSRWMSHPETAKTAMQQIMGMNKIDIAIIEKALNH